MIINSISSPFFRMSLVQAKAIYSEVRTVVRPERAVLMGSAEGAFWNVGSAFSGLGFIQLYPYSQGTSGVLKTQYKQIKCPLLSTALRTRRATAPSTVTLKVCWCVSASLIRCLSVRRSPARLCHAGWVGMCPCFLCFHYCHSPRVSELSIQKQVC